MADTHKVMSLLHGFLYLFISPPPHFYRNNKCALYSPQLALSVDMPFPESQYALSSLIVYIMWNNEESKMEILDEPACR